MNMATHLSINNPKDLHSVHDLIHDSYFDIDEIAFDRSSAVLSFRFRRLVTKGKFWVEGHSFAAARCVLPSRVF